mmetsp:Transcript_49759/g.139261  ORF Transcript_49759/g.139261 Transcript_49759/m.139261 type:complete len:301 (-) Transcript_49759:9-911(-)
MQPAHFLPALPILKPRPPSQRQRLGAARLATQFRRGAPSVAADASPRHPRPRPTPAAAATCRAAHRTPWKLSLKPTPPLASCSWQRPVRPGHGIRPLRRPLQGRPGTAPAAAVPRQSPPTATGTPQVWFPGNPTPTCFLAHSPPLSKIPLFSRRQRPGAARPRPQIRRGAPFAAASDSPRHPRLRSWPATAATCPAVRNSPRRAARQPSPPPPGGVGHRRVPPASATNSIQRPPPRRSVAAHAAPVSPRSPPAASWTPRAQLPSWPKPPWFRTSPLPTSKPRPPSRRRPPGAAPPRRRIR